MKNENLDTTDDRENKEFLVSVFARAVEKELDDETREYAADLARAYVGADVPPKSPLYMMMTGFILGMNEGMRVSSAAYSAAD